MSDLSFRVQKVKPSPTIAVSMRAAELKASGRDIISLSIGEPDFDTPLHIKEAAIKAIRDGFTKYTAVDGIPSLKKAIISKLERENHLFYDPKQILVSCGVKHALYNLLQALINPGDEVIIPAPYWVSYPDMVLLADGQPVFIATGLSEQFKITPEQLEAAITPKTRLLILNSPSNPSGSVYSKAELAKLAAVLLKHPKVWIATDDMYEHIIWSEESFTNIINACPELYERTVVFNGVSKSYAMTGWRIGYAAGPRALIQAMTTIQSQITSNPNSIAQVAAQAALDGDQAPVHEMARMFKERHDLVYTQLSEIEHIDCLASKGSFYSFPNVSKLLKIMGMKDDIAFAELLLNRAEVAVVPGSAFGNPGYIRISFATDMENLIQAFTRIKMLLAQAAVL